MKQCKQCGMNLKNRVAVYCSNQCQVDFQYQRYIYQWKTGKVNGSRGINAKDVSKHVKRYIYEKFRASCVLCGWDKVNPTTGQVPVEIDHIDGNAENNHENNLRILCPNCHSLTANFRNLNSGHGREWRRLKYIKSR